MTLPLRGASNIEVTDPSVNTSLMAVARIGAIDSTVSLELSLGGIGSVSVTTTSRSATAGDDRELIAKMPGTAATMTSSAPFSNSVSAAFTDAAGVDHVVDNHADSILHIADDFEDSDLARHVGVTAFVEDREGAEDVGPCSATRTRPASGDTR